MDHILSAAPLPPGAVDEIFDPDVYLEELRALKVSDEAAPLYVQLAMSTWMNWGEGRRTAENYPLFASRFPLIPKPDGNKKVLVACKIPEDTEVTRFQCGKSSV